MISQNHMKNKKIWFKRKRYGWGWTPTSWEGWLVLLFYLVAMLYDFRNIDSVQHSGSGTLINFAPRFVILTIILIAICYYKGESPKWTWGNKNKN